MGVVRGSLNCTRFLVNGEPDEGFREAAREKVVRYSFKRLHEDSDQERAVGWVNILDEYQRGFLGDEYFKEPYIALSLRVDTRSVPARALRQYCREAEDEIKEREGLEFLSKKRREEVRDAVRARLLRRAIPRTAVYDMVWDLQRGLVLFGATSTRLCDEFAEIFYNTFELRLTSVYPYSLAYRLLQDKGLRADGLNDVRPFGLDRGAES